MYINRAKALLLVGTISAGCASANEDDGPGAAGAAGAAGAGTGGSAPSAGGSGQGGGGAGSGGTPSAGSAGQGGGGSGGTPSAGGSGASGPDAGSSDAGNADAGNPDAGNPDPGGTDGADAGGDAGGTLTCDDTADTVVSCSGLGQLECTGLEGFLSSECEMIAFIMKPTPANAARNCMIALEPPELCDATNTYSCIVEALGSSCPDPEADDECTIIAAECDDSLPAFSACTSMLSGMTQSGRDQMVQCMTAPCDLYACIEGLQVP